MSFQIFCIVLGDAISYSFPVDVNEDTTVGRLKKLIKKEKENTFASVDANELKLWSVNIPITRENKDTVMYSENIKEQYQGIMISPFKTVGDYFRPIPTSTSIRIIVQPPTTTDKRSADVSHGIANLGYLPRRGGLGGTSLPIDLRIKSSNEGVNINDPDVSLRFDIIPLLIKDLEDRNVILVQAPPFSGKTSMTQILENNLVHAPEFSNRRIIRVSMIWGQNVGVQNCFDSFNVLWNQIMGIDWIDWIAQCRFIKTILIIDEAQLIYWEAKKVDQNNMESADQFWMIVKSALQEMANIKIIMFAAYGYRSSNYMGLTTPITLPESNCKSLIDINFKLDELKRYIEKFCGNYFKNLDPPSVSKLYKYIWVVTKGHAGLVRHVLVSTENAMRRRIDTNYLSWEEIFKYLNSKDFDSSIYNNCRAVPKVSALSNKQISLCEDVYLNEKFFYPDSDENAVYLVRSGILIIENDIYLSFAAPLLKRSFFQQNYGVQNSTYSTPTDLHHFVVKIFTAICNELSGKILRDTLGFGSDGRILKQKWQKEFYRIGTQVLGKGHFLSCDVGSVFGCDGKIDFYVDKLDWAIELLRDGDDMAEHDERFNSLTGEYKEIVKYAKSIAIIDIRSEVKNVRKLRKDFIHVSCSKDFDAFKIESLGKETVTIRFQN